MVGDGILDDLKGILRSGLRRALAPLVEPRVQALNSETRELRAQLAEANEKVDALSELVGRLDEVLRERNG